MKNGKMVVNKSHPLPKTQRILNGKMVVNKSHPLPKTQRIFIGIQPPPYTKNPRNIIYYRDLSEYVKYLYLLRA